MGARRSAEDLSLAELERLVLLRRREERLRRLRERGIAREVPELPPLEAPAPGTYDELAFLQQPRHRPGVAGAAVRRRGVREQLLFLVEIAGLAGLLAALVLFMADLRRLNTAAASEQDGRLAAVATLEAPVELPGGSRPPAAGAVPAIYQDWIEPVRTDALVPVGDTTAEQRPTRLVIPRIGVDAPVVPGDDWEALKQGVGHHLGSANPGARGNMVVSAHNDIFGEIFRDLNQLKTGDEVIVYDAAGQASHYRVASKRIVEPTDVSVLDPTNEPVITLITCHPYLIDTQRLVVVAQLAND
ncbi:MAG: sortase [Ardenticatenaceae bacterium]|nr:sortase [Ardenticatenaceae bacterium]